MRRRTLIAVALLGLTGWLACGTSPYSEPFRPRVARPKTGEIVLVSDFMMIFDASGSIDRKWVFPEEKAFFESFMLGMPNGRYRAGITILGGRQRDQVEPAPFDRYPLHRRARDVKWTGRETPLAEVFATRAELLPAQPGRFAFVILSDGLPTRYGKYIGPDETLAAAQRLVDTYLGEICIHALQIGADPRGPALLAALAALSDCGSFRNLADVSNREALYDYQQAMFNGPAPPPKVQRPRAMTDLDEDGVDDRHDRCARTPLGAVVDARGCWVIKDYVFGTNRATIRPEHADTLTAIVKVLERNPRLRIRIDGHTDNTGNETYNFDLAQRRANAVRQYLERMAIAPERLEQRSFGSSRPIASNDTDAERSQNRRVELSVIDR
jgi:outer membrane protein OmpA-like peptidoglycan-associated protein